MGYNNFGSNRQVLSAHIAAVIFPFFHKKPPHVPEKVADQISHDELTKQNSTMAGVDPLHGFTYSDIAKKTDTVIGFMTTNPEVKEITRRRSIDGEDVIGKDMSIKPKSADASSFPGCSEAWGFIPVYQSLFAKGTKEQKEKADKYIKSAISKENPVLAGIPLRNESGKTLYFETDGQGRLYSFRFLSENEAKKAKQQGCDLKLYKILAKKKNNGKYVPIVADNDIAAIGTNNVTTDNPVFDSQKGIYLPIEKKALDLLIKRSNGMVFHGAENHNPYGFDFPQITGQKPQVFYTPDGESHVIKSEEQLLKFINNWRHPDRNPMGKAYNLTLNPRAGFEVDENGDIVRGTKGAEYKAMQAEINKETDPSRHKHLQKNFDRQMRVKEMEMSLPVVERQGDEVATKAYSEKRESLKNFDNAMKIIESKIALFLFKRCESLEEKSGKTRILDSHVCRVVSDRLKNSRFASMSPAC